MPPDCRRTHVHRMSHESTFILICLEGERPSKGLITHSTTEYNVPGTILLKILALLRSGFNKHTTPVQVFVKCPGVACIYAITSTKLEVRVLACDWRRRNASLCIRSRQWGMPIKLFATKPIVTNMYASLLRCIQTHRSI